MMSLNLINFMFSKRIIRIRIIINIRSIKFITIIIAIIVGVIEFIIIIFIVIFIVIIVVNLCLLFRKISFKWMLQSLNFKM
jgi:hypothetical protein